MIKKKHEFTSLRINLLFIFLSVLTMSIHVEIIVSGRRGGISKQDKYDY